MAEKSPLAKQAAKWIAEAEADKQTHQTWLNDFYRYCLPHRRRPGNYLADRPVHDQDQLYDSTAIEALSSFAADMQGRFTPPAKDWLSVGPARALQQVEAVQIRESLAQYQNVAFSDIRRSNFSEASQECYPDLAAGTIGMCIQDIGITEPIHCQAIPVTDLLIVRGVYGGVDFRGRRLSVKYTQLQATYPKAKFPPEIASKITTAQTARAQVVECCWRLYDKPKTERWQYLLLVDNQEGDSEILEGQGSCPIIVARWKTDSTTAWGVGPAYTVLPTIRTLDQLCYLILKRMNLVVNPIFVADDDGILNFDQGLVPGDVIFRAPGSKIEILESENPFDAVFFERTSMQDEIRRAFFQDKPTQSGDTPPTATQWLDENSQIDKRMGAPIGRLVSEWQVPVFARFAYLLKARGSLPEVKLNGAAIQLQPQSPLIRAQQHEEVVIADNLLKMAAAYFGQQLPIMIDGRQTLENIKVKLEDDVVALRSEMDIQKIAQLGAAAAAQANGAQQGQQPGQAPGQGQ